MSEDNHHKWTNQFSRQCSTFYSLIPGFTSVLPRKKSSFNNQNKINHQRSWFEGNHTEMSHKYRSYASSLSRSRKNSFSYKQLSMFDYLKNLQFIKTNHNSSCLNQKCVNTKKEKKCGLKKAGKYKQPQKNRNISLSYANTVQLSYFPQHVIRTVDHNINQQSKNNVMIYRSTSAPKFLSIPNSNFIQNYDQPYYQHNQFSMLNNNSKMVNFNSQLIHFNQPASQIKSYAGSSKMIKTTNNGGFSKLKFSYRNGDNLTKTIDNKQINLNLGKQDNKIEISKHQFSFNSNNGVNFFK